MKGRKKMSAKSFKGFYRFTEPESRDKNLEEQFNIVQKVTGDGVEYEFMISFYRYDKSRLRGLKFSMMPSLHLRKTANSLTSFQL